MRRLPGLPLRLLVLSAGVLLPAACSRDPVPPVQPPPDTLALPLPELGIFTYRGQLGGLYPLGQNTMPTSHATVGALRADEIFPRDADGQPLGGGHIVVLALGPGSARQQFAAFSTRAATAADTRPEVLLLNGARDGYAADAWDAATGAAYDWVRDSVLTPAGVTERQVQAIWLKAANATASGAPSFPSTNADAYLLLERLGRTARALRQRYPNVQHLYLSSRVFGGHAPAGSGGAEPYAYETGFAVRMLVEAQIRQVIGEGVNNRTGDLGPEITPWLAWGPYLWGRGTDPRWDGLRWEPADFEADGVSVSAAGAAKVAALLHDYFRNAPWARCWFIAGQSC